MTRLQHPCTQFPTRGYMAGLGEFISRAPTFFWLPFKPTKRSRSMSGYPLGKMTKLVPIGKANPEPRARTENRLIHWPGVTPAGHKKQKYHLRPQKLKEVRSSGGRVHSVIEFLTYTTSWEDEKQGISKIPTIER